MAFRPRPTQDTVDALERVRQLFAAGCIQSAYWHRFAATAHSPIGLHPQKYGITLRPPANISFAHNDIEFDDPVGTDHDYLGGGLRKALYNYMHGVGLDADVREWFEPDGGAPAPPQCGSATGAAVLCSRHHRTRGPDRALPRLSRC